MIFFVIILAVILVGFNYLKIIVREFNHEGEVQLEQVVKAIEDEFNKYHYGLQGAKGIVVTSEEKKLRKAFRKYSQSRNNFINFPGALGFGFIRAVKKEHLNRYSIEHKSFFKIHPQAESNLHMIIEIIEPAESNNEALGLDVSFEENRKNSAVLSAESGKAALTFPIELVQKRSKHVGFLYYLPVYKDVIEYQSVSERMHNLVGWAYAPIVLNELMENLKQKIPRGVRIEISIDGKEATLSAGENVRWSRILNNKFSSTASIVQQSWKINLIKNNKDLRILLGFITITILVLSLFITIAFLKSLEFFETKSRVIYEKESWYKKLFESASTSIIGINAEGIIISANKKAAELLGLKPETDLSRLNINISKFSNKVSHDLSGQISKIQNIKDKVDLIFNNYGAHAKAFDGVNKADMNSITFDTEYTAPNNELLNIKVTISKIFGIQNELIGYLLMMDDMTETKRNLQIIKEQEAKMINSAKLSTLGEMAGGIAHEINTPLAVIIGKIYQIRKHSSSELSEKVRNELIKIEATANRIGKIIKGLRAFSRNANSDPLDEVNILNVINITFELCMERLKVLDIKLMLEVEDNLTILGRDVELSQVFMNLISNSIDAVAHLPERWIKIKAFKIAHQVEISFKDSGVGISKDISKKMMNPFFTTKEIGKGTGLGLSISKGIIDSYNGILFYDEKSKNTTFVIQLPYYKSNTHQRVI